MRMRWRSISQAAAVAKPIKVAAPVTPTARAWTKP